MIEMKQQLSALMDGEIDMEANPHWLDDMIHQKEMTETWRTYHIIGDTLRGDTATNNITRTIAEKLKSEPVVLAPKPRIKNIFTHRYATSMAASVAAVAFVGWVVWQAQGVGNNQPVTSLAQNPATQVEQSALNDKMDDYMMAHHEYASANPMRYGVEVRNAALSESSN